MRVCQIILASCGECDVVMCTGACQQQATAVWVYTVSDSHRFLTHCMCGIVSMHSCALSDMLMSVCKSGHNGADV